MEMSSIRNNIRFSNILFWSLLCIILIVMLTNLNISINNEQFFLNALLTFFTITTALLVYFKGQRNSHNDKIEEQANIMDGVVSELDFIEGNINWYKEEMNKDSFLKLDHSINKIHVENYLSRLKGSFFN